MIEEAKPYKSRTQQKKEAEDLQDLGLKLTSLTREQLENARIPEDLKAAVILFKSITSKNAAKRQRQYIGALMRDVDPEQIHRVLRHAKMNPKPVSKADTTLQNRIDRLLSGGPREIERLLEDFPQLERQRLRQLVRNVQKAVNKKNHFKSFRQLQTMIQRAL